MSKYLVAWSNRAAGTWGHGRPTDYDTARALVERMSAEYPDIHHAECDVSQFRSFLVGTGMNHVDAIRKANKVFAEG